MLTLWGLEVPCVSPGVHDLFLSGPVAIAMGSQKSTTRPLFMRCILSHHFFGDLWCFMDVYGCLFVVDIGGYWWIRYISAGVWLYTPPDTPHQLASCIEKQQWISWRPRDVSSSSSTMNTPCLADHASMIPNLDNLHSCILSPFSHLQFTSFARKMLMFAGRIPHHCWNLHLCGWKPHVC